jgi:hypothetical protein
MALRLVQTPSKGPEENVFDSLCVDFGGVPGGIYSPAAGDGFYVLLDPLKKGKHTLRIYAEKPAGTVNQDVTYNLTVVPVVLQ